MTIEAFIDKVEVLKESLRKLQAEREQFTSGGVRLQNTVDGQPQDSAAQIIQNLDREIHERRVEIVALGGDPNYDGSASLISPT